MSTTNYLLSLIAGFYFTHFSQLWDVDISHIYNKEISSSATNKRKNQTTLTGPSSSIKKPILSLKRNQTKNQCTLQNNAKTNQKSIHLRTMDNYNTNVNLIGDYKN